MSEPQPLALQVGDRVRIVRGNLYIDATVKTVSPNFQSVGLVFLGHFFGYVDSMPLLFLEGHYRDLLARRDFEIKTSTIQ